MKKSRLLAPAILAAALGVATAARASGPDPFDPNARWRNAVVTRTAEDAVITCDAVRRVSYAPDGRIAVLHVRILKQRLAEPRSGAVTTNFECAAPAGGKPPCVLELKANESATLRVIADLGARADGGCGLRVGGGEPHSGKLSAGRSRCTISGSADLVRELQAGKTATAEFREKAPLDNRSAAQRIDFPLDGFTAAWDGLIRCASGDEGVTEK